jgi:transposase
LDTTEQAALKAAVAAPPADAAIPAATWSWKAVRQFVAERFGKRPSPRSCLRYLHRLGFVWKRPKRRLLKADPVKREAFVAQYRDVVADATALGARIFFVDEAHFRADGDLRGLWTPKGKPALVDSTSPKYGEKASYYSAVCLETGEVLAAELKGNSSAVTTRDFLLGMRTHYTGPLIIVWDNSSAHRGEAIREFLRTPKLDLRLVALPAYSPDFNADEAIWKWIREEVTANTCFGTAAKVAEAVGRFFDAVDHRAEEVTRRCRTVLQTLAFPDSSTVSHTELLAGSAM